jgi:predicted acylesterase/phospholipase RssA
MARHTGIVLGGGGLLGDFQVGALKYLYKHKVKDDEIACVRTSVGAMSMWYDAYVQYCEDTRVLPR